MGRPLRALLLSPFVRQRFAWFVAKERASDLERLTELIEAGKVTPSIDRTFSLDEVPDAMQSASRPARCAARSPSRSEVEALRFDVVAANEEQDPDDQVGGDRGAEPA